MACAAAIDSSSSRKSPILCKFYMNGVCRDGNSCRYSHDRENSVPDMVCRYYLQGCCSYGANCRYDHVKPRPAHPTTPLLQPSAFQSSVSIVPPSQNSNPEAQNSALEKTENKPIDLWDKDIQDGIDTFYGNGFWSSAPSANDKVILRGGRIKTKADWAKDSPVFVPKSQANVPAPSYAQVADTTATPKEPSDNFDELNNRLSDSLDEISIDLPKETVYTGNEELCPYLAHGACPNMKQCKYIHGDVCEMCGLHVLHPTDMEQRQKHESECLREHEANMEYSFLVAESKDKECSICMEVVLEKTPPDNRFGLMINCCHVFCLTCIRKWRSSSSLAKDVIRRCPECRTPSNYVTPSNVWVEDQEMKTKIITNYKKTLKNKACKYFDQGRKMCPFSDSCFYLHAYPDGTIATPDQQVRQRQRADANGRMSIVNAHSLWDFIFQREQSAFYDDDDLSFSPITTDSDSDDIS